jgi:hypothetical protein
MTVPSKKEKEKIEAIYTKAVCVLPHDTNREFLYHPFGGRQKYVICQNSCS